MSATRFILPVEQGINAVDLDQHQRLRVRREAEVVGLFHHLHHPPVHHLHRRRSSPDAITWLTVSQAASLSAKKPRLSKAGGLGHEAHPDRGDNPERPLAGTDQARQVERAGFVTAVARSRFQDRSVGEHHLHAEHVVGRDEVLERVDAPGVGGGVAADGAGALAGGVGGEVVPGAAGSRAAASLSCVLRTPASTWATRLSRSIFRMRFIRVVETMTPCSNATHPPARPVPEPRGTICTPWRARTFTTRITSSSVPGTPRRAGRALAMVNPSLS
jgi:hypothetical protein